MTIKKNTLNTLKPAKYDFALLEHGPQIALTSFELQHTSVTAVTVNPSKLGVNKQIHITACSGDLSFIGKQHASHQVLHRKTIS